jgi:hypothetical protein
MASPRADRPSLDELRSRLRRRGDAVPLEDFGRLSSGFPELDRALCGGYPKGGLVELIAPPGAGGSSVALAAAVRLSREGNLVALLDPTTSFDPASAARAGADLERFLWVRPRDLAETLEAADLLLEGGSFPLVLLDLACLRPAQSPPPPSVWARLAGRLRRVPVVLLVLTGQPLVGALARVTLAVSPGACRCLPESPLAVSRRLAVEVLRNRAGPAGSRLELELCMAPSAMDPWCG